MTAPSAFYRSSVGKKFIVAQTGIILILFIIGHLIGNLQTRLDQQLRKAFTRQKRLAVLEQQ